MMQLTHGDSLSLPLTLQKSVKVYEVLLGGLGGEAGAAFSMGGGETCL
jgi:hypothetical protein